MLIISSRRDFSDPDALSNLGHSFRDIDFSNDAVVRSFQDIADFSQAIQGNILLLVHGYNNEQEDVYDAYSVIQEKIRNRLSHQYDLVIGYSWPGGDDALDWYTSKRRANAVARRFRFLLQDLSPLVRGIDVMSHSLGARVVLKALKQAPLTNGGPLVRNYFSMAASVDNEVFEPDEEFHDCIRNIGSIFVFHSKKDGVLGVMYRLSELDRALGLSGPEDKAFVQYRVPSMYVINCKREIESHGGYKHSDALYSYIAKALKGQATQFETL